MIPLHVVNQMNTQLAELADHNGPGYTVEPYSSESWSFKENDVKNNVSCRDYEAYDQEIIISIIMWMSFFPAKVLPV